MSNQSTGVPLLLSLGLVVAGLLIGVIGGLSSGSLVGGLVAGAGVIPACYCAWLGIQQETQSTLLWSILLILGSLGIGALLLILWLVSAVF